MQHADQVSGKLTSGMSVRTKVSRDSHGIDSTPKSEKPAGAPDELGKAFDLMANGTNSTMIRDAGKTKASSKDAPGTGEKSNPFK